MLIGIILVVLAIICYFTNIFLIRYYIEKKIPGLIDTDLSLPKPGKDEEYLWEKTAGTRAVPKWVSIIGILAIPLLICGILLIAASVISKKESEVLVIPGESIAGVKLDMSYEQVISILGEPAEKITTDDLKKIRGEFRVAGKGKFEDEMPTMKILHYIEPPLVVVLNENNNVNSLQLGYTDNVNVQGFSFLKFKYISRDELNRLGKPSSVTRDEQAEMTLMAKTSGEQRIEYYLYDYKEIGLLLGLVFDKLKEQESDYFIGLNYISILKGESIIK